MRPLISVIMISYNQQEFIEESLLSAIEQRSDKYGLEILIVDDGSVDETQSIIANYSNKYPDLIFPTFKKHVGVTAINKNLNELIAKAKGEYIAFLAGDDKFTPNRFEKQLSAFYNDETIDLVISDGINYQVSTSEFLGKCQEESIVKMIQKGELSKVSNHITSNIPALYIQGYLCKKEMLKKIGCFDESVIADDWVLNIRMFNYLSKHGRKAIYLDDVVFQRNLHTSNTSFHFEDQYSRVSQVIWKYVQNGAKQYMLAELNFRYIRIALTRMRFIKALSLIFQYLKFDPSLLVLRKYFKKKFIKLYG